MKFNSFVIPIGMARRLQVDRDKIPVRETHGEILREIKKDQRDIPRNFSGVSFFFFFFFFLFFSFYLVEGI